MIPSEAMEKIRALAARIDSLGAGREPPLKDMTAEELSDLRRVLSIAEYVLERHQDREDLRDILRELVGVVKSSAASIRGLDSDIEDLAAEAQAHISRIRAAQSSMPGSVKRDPDV